MVEDRWVSTAHSRASGQWPHLVASVDRFVFWLVFLWEPHLGTRQDTEVLMPALADMEGPRMVALQWDPGNEWSPRPASWASRRGRSHHHGHNV